MSDDFIRELWSIGSDQPNRAVQLCHQAADEIERLRAEVAGADADKVTEFEVATPAFEDDPVAMRLGFTPVKPGVRLPGTPEHCHLCALDEIERLRIENANVRWQLDFANDCLSKAAGLLSGED